MIKIRLFAAAKQLVGSDSIELEMDEPISIERLSDIILAKHQGLSSLLPFVRFAVNSEYVENESMVRPGDEIAIIPPVSGG